MRQNTLKNSLLALVACTLTGLAPAIASAQDHQEDHRDQPGDQRSEQRGDAHRDEHHDDPADQYRHDHPHATARCHDGFFTTTRDRDHACRRHGGIDVWLLL